MPINQIKWFYSFAFSSLPGLFVFEQQPFMSSFTISLVMQGVAESRKRWIKWNENGWHVNDEKNERKYLKTWYILFFNLK